MKRFKLSEFKDGWFIGDFKPSVLRTAVFEAGIKYHSAGENWPNHYQKTATEYNVVISGKLKIGKEWFVKDDVFVVEPKEAVKPHFYSDCVVVVVKVPSLPADKVVIP